MTSVFVFEYVSAFAGAGDAWLLAQGVAMRDALAADLGSAGCDVSLADRALEAEQSAFDFVARQAASHDRVWVIAPESARILERLHAAVGDACWIGCDAASIRIASSKRQTLQRLASRGITTALAFEDAATRWVVKPDDGAGALDTRVHSTRDAAEADRSRRASRAVVEPWVCGEPLSLSLLCAGGEAEMLAINRQRIDIDTQGMVAYRGVEIAAIDRADARAAPLREMSSRIARALPGLRGYAGVDCVWHAERGPIAIEINPRLTCAYVGLSARLGRNLAAEVLALHG